MKKLFFSCILLVGSTQAAINIWKFSTLPEKIIKPLVTKMIELFSSDANKQRSLDMYSTFRKPVEEPAAQESNLRKIVKGPLVLAQE